MLRIGATVAVPSVIGNVDENRRAPIGELAHFIGEYGFVADEQAEPLVSRIQRLARRAMLKLADLFRQAAGKRKYAWKRKVLSERHQMSLVVPRRPLAARTDQRGGVEERAGLRTRGRIRRGSDGSDDCPGVGVASHRTPGFAEPCIVGEKWRGRLWPYDQIDFHARAAGHRLGHRSPGEIG